MNPFGWLIKGGCIALGGVVGGPAGAIIGGIIGGAIAGSMTGDASNAQHGQDDPSTALDHGHSHDVGSILDSFGC